MQAASASASWPKSLRSPDGSWPPHAGPAASKRTSWLKSSLTPGVRIEHFPYAPHCPQTAALCRASPHWPTIEGLEADDHRAKYSPYRTAERPDCADRADGVPAFGGHGGVDKIRLPLRAGGG